MRRIGGSVAGLRSLSVTVLVAALLVPAMASAAAAADTASRTVTGMSKTYKNSEVKRAKRAVRSTSGTTVTTAVTTTAPTAKSPSTSSLTSSLVGPAPVLAAPKPAGNYAEQVLAHTNTHRSKHGLRPLAASTCAAGFASSWARALSVAGSLSHQALDPILSTCQARGVGENVAFGSVTAEKLVQMWMDSPAHRANILSPAFTHLGVGHVTTSTGRVYGVQVFLSL
jgi:uncharacterized protein YkwD